MSGHVRRLRLAMLGEAGTGKSSLVQKLIRPSGRISMYNPTIEDSHQLQIDVDDKQCMLEILDTSGIDELAVKRQEWIEQSDGVILVYDLSRRDSFDKIQDWIYRMQATPESHAMASTTPMHTDMRNSHRGNRVHRTVTLVGNKCDLIRAVSESEGQALAQGLGWTYVETSARLGTNVDLVFLDAAGQLLSLDSDANSKQRWTLSTFLLAFDLGKATAAMTSWFPSCLARKR
ncbi:Hypothetical protein R9X50_00406500 [Acrodontium crateriforme]|uniref:P-loop containing nucleoside triphosphate hydrolase protein n=1 Tax=Acrodontium crateriforme TaxID=150365 RepID=A0AAQ3R814_9PEZI|nr:Hypothetical protein R9X50_00406500 [Acrodontium crateriforme]